MTNKPRCDLKTNEENHFNWEDRVVTPDEVLAKIQPGMSIFIGTGVSEPRTLVKKLMSSGKGNLQDLELIQVVSLGDAISLKELRNQKYRLKTFFSGWVASEAITTGMVDLIPSRFSMIPKLISSRQIPIDVAFIQISPPNEAGYCSLGLSVDVAHEAIAQASLVVGEINRDIPITYGDTFFPVSEFDMLIQSTEPPIYFPRWPIDDIYDKVAENVASVILDGSCIFFSIGPLYEALSCHLSHKRNLGVHTPFFTDALMDLVKSGAVTNRNKATFRGKSVASYAFGTKELFSWLHRNPIVEFQSVDKVFDSLEIGKNPGFVCILPARKVDLSGRIALHYGKGNVTAGPGEAMDFFNGAEISRGGYSVFALPSRNLKQESNIKISVENYHNLFNVRESVNMVVTEYGVANLAGRTLRERAQALIEIAHPNDREELIQQAKEQKIIYQDQIFIAEAASFYPSEVATKHTFKGGIEVRFRAIRPSDEEEMRKLFYRFSDEAVYYRYFAKIKAMPHSKMQSYVNVDYRTSMSIVGVVGDPGQGKIISEARFIKDKNKPPFADVAFIVDEEYHGIGIASYLYKMLIRIAKDRGIHGFTADVLASNTAMMKVFAKGGTVKAELDYGTYSLKIPFDPDIVE
ncbi:MAG: GNAT family N-acetyltransferase [Pseudomonadota bacterium]